MGSNTTICSPVDPLSKALVRIPTSHREVHAGNAFTVSDVQNINTTSVKWLITTPNTSKFTHMIFDIDGTGEFYVVVTEGADRTGTNLLACINRNRTSSNTAGTIVHRAYSEGSTDGATTIFAIRLGATGSASKTISSGGKRGLNEFVLKPNTKYVVSITTYADIWISLGLDWYEKISGTP